MKKNIEVSYDGKWPCTCMGTLIIKINGEEIYNKTYCCHSTGSVSFDEEWNEFVESGELIWEDAKYFNKEIQKAVRKVLEKCEVCCGGCV